MTKQKILAGLFILVMASLVISACAGTQTAAPTAQPEDANAIYTQAAQTVEANATMTAAVMPSNTPAPTDMPTAAPTNTLDPTNAAMLTATVQAIQPGGATVTPALAGGQATPTLKVTLAGLPTATSAVVAAPPKATGDKVELNSQSPKDGIKVQKNASFDMNIVLKNTGTTTWSTKYALVFYAGDRMGSPTDFQMPNEVKPGELVKLTFTLTAPDTTGKKRTIWAVRNGDGVNFYELWLDTEVTD